MSYNIESLSVSFDSSKIKPEKPETLMDFVKIASEIQRDEKSFVFIRVSSNERPISLLSNNSWLATVESTGGNQWKIGIWVQTLQAFRAMRPDNEVGLAAAEIFQMIEDLPPNEWRSLPYKRQEFGNDNSPMHLTR